METSSTAHLVNVNWIEGVIVVEFTKSSIVENNSVRAVSEQFNQLLGLSARFVLNFEGVRQFSSSMIGELIKFSKKVSNRGGTVALCCVSGEIYDVFRLLRIDKLFPMYDDIRTAFGAITS